jgi:phosphoribosylformylglycinamidine cyclo-ligase
MNIDYKSSGVNIDAGNQFVDYIKNKVNRTFTPNVLNGIGGFASLFSLQDLGIDLNKAVMVSSTDGVGTKVKIAQAINKHNTIGIDCVAMCVNDLICQGALPLFFLDYIACGSIHQPTMQSLMDGIVEGCLNGKMSLIGGETAEMPGVYANEVYDLAGFAVGIVENDKMLPNLPSMRDGDILIGLHSTGLHSNGFSLVRKIFETLDINYNDQCELDNLKSWGEYLLAPTKIYVDIALKLKQYVKGFAHITGGGITENLPRILPKNFYAEINSKSWTSESKIFEYMHDNVKSLSNEEMYRVFNMGIGMIAICDSNNIDEIRKILNENNEKFSEIGYLKTSSKEEPEVIYINN